MKQKLLMLLFSSLILLGITVMLYPRNDVVEFFQDLTARPVLNSMESEMANQPNIRIDDTQDIYSIIDNPFWESGKTPKFIWISFAGIELGEKWHDEALTWPPLTGTYKCTHINSTHWTYEREDILIDFNFVSGRFRVYAVYFDESNYYAVFIDRTGTYPYLSDKNYLQTYAGNYFYGGFYFATWTPFSDPSSIAEIAGNVVLDRNTKVFYQGIAKSETTGVYRFSRKSDATCIKIVVDKEIPE